MKLKSIYILIINFIFFLTILLLLNITLKTSNYLYIINIIFNILFILITFILIYILYIKEIKQTIKLLNHYDENNFSYSIYNNINKDFTKLNGLVESLGQKLKNLQQMYNEVSEENKNYYVQYQLDLENKKQLVASISHEIKTPLAVIEATASGLIDNIFNDDEKEKELTNIIDECDKTTKMLQDIVNIYKIDSSNYKLDLKECNLEDLIIEILDFYKSLIIKYKKNIKILNDLTFKYNLNPTQFKKALNNIILNAIIYSPLESDITISLTDHKDYKVLEIINYNTNISKEDIKNVFEPFYRVDKARTKKEDHGNGLGLYIVKQILEKHNLDFGIINVYNGVKFYIVFPILNLN